MKKLFVAILAAGLILTLILMAGCSSEPGKPAASETPQPKAPEAITGSSAFFKCYISARIWAPDAQPYRVESYATANTKGRDGKVEEWRAGFASPSKHSTKSYTSANSDISQGVDATYNR